MLTGTLRNEVDKLWEMFWTGGLTNPLDVIDLPDIVEHFHNLSGEKGLLT